MKITNMRWAGNLLVSCSINGKPAIFRTDHERFVQEQTEDWQYPLLEELPFGIGKFINRVRLTRQIEEHLKFVEGYYDKESNLLYTNKIFKDSDILKAQV